MQFPDGYLLVKELTENPVELFYLLGALILLCFFARWLDKLEAEKKRKPGVKKPYSG